MPIYENWEVRENPDGSFHAIHTHNITTYLYEDTFTKDFSHLIKNNTMEIQDIKTQKSFMLGQTSRGESELDGLMLELMPDPNNNDVKFIGVLMDMNGIYHFAYHDDDYTEALKASKEFPNDPVVPAEKLLRTILVDTTRFVIIR